MGMPCMSWCPDDTGVTFWPNPGFLPKEFLNQVIDLMAFESQSAEHSQLCSVQALQYYSSTRQLFIHWIVLVFDPYEHY